MIKPRFVINGLASLTGTLIKFDLIWCFKGLINKQFCIMHLCKGKNKTPKKFEFWKMFVIIFYCLKVAPPLWVYFRVQGVIHCWYQGCPLPQAPPPCQLNLLKNRRRWRQRWDQLLPSWSRSWGSYSCFVRTTTTTYRSVPANYWTV